MAKNRKKSRKMSVITSRTAHIASVLGVLFAVVVLNMSAESVGAHTLQEIGKKERMLKTLDQEFERETWRWDQMKTPGNLDAMLAKHGLRMIYPRPDQYVRMDASGTPVPGQYSVANARRQAARPAVATATHTARPRGKVRR